VALVGGGIETAGAGGPPPPPSTYTSSFFLLNMATMILSNKMQLSTASVKAEVVQTSLTFYPKMAMLSSNKGITGTNT
jgi:hypothetical protein